MYNLPSLIPVLLSRGANPNIQTARGNLTPLHLAAGAGNSAIVELLVRNGCALNMPDSFGSYPVDHAIRNGFTSVSEYLQSQILKQKALRNVKIESSNHHEDEAMQDDSKNVYENYEQEKFLLQSAFSNLSLKDKLIFNMMVKRRGRSNTEVIKQSPVIPEEEDLSVKREEYNYDTMKDINCPPSGKKVDKSAAWEQDSVDSVITDTDKESLDIAMKLMNTEVRSQQ